MKQKEEILAIVNSTQSRLNSEKVSTLLNDCLRIAILRNDFINQWWIRWEFCSINDKEGKKKYPKSIEHKFTPENYERFWKENLDAWMIERKLEVVNSETDTIDSSKILALSIFEIENDFESAQESLKNITVPDGLDSNTIYKVEAENFDARRVLEPFVKSYKNIFGRIRIRIADFLNTAEHELLSGNTQSEIFLRTKEFVDRKLADIAPDALQKFISIDLDSENKETFAHSLVTCRRVLKSFADSIYPPSSKQVLCSDGKNRILDNEKYVNRIWQYIFETLGTSSSARLIQSQLESLGHRVDHIYELTNKGIHSEVNEQEANQCVIQTYLIIGDVLNIKK